MTREEILLWLFAIYGVARFLLDLSKMVDWWVKKKKGDRDETDTKRDD